MSGRELRLIAIEGIGEIGQGDDLAGVIVDALGKNGETLCEGDVLVVAQKVVSKAEGRMVVLDDITVSAEAGRLSAATCKDARLCQVLLDETAEVVRRREGLVIVEDRRGLVLANAGIDASNVSDREGRVLLLPVDPDQSARNLREAIGGICAVMPGVIVADSIGRAWRMGTIGTAIGAAGIATVLDLRGEPDMHGRKLETTEVGLADEIASAASLLMGQAAERCPVVLVRGLSVSGTGSARDLLRPRQQDLFR